MCQVESVVGCAASAVMVVLFVSGHTGASSAVRLTQASTPLGLSDPYPAPNR
jgi:hypothetical protein